MPRSERVREPMTTPPSPDYVRQKAESGWRLAAVEWERTLEGAGSDAGVLEQEIPYGLRVASDCSRLEESPEEKEAMTLMLELIVEDRSLSQVAEGLDRQGLRTRDGRRWTQTAVFYMLPRLIEVAPVIFASDEWRRRRGEVTARLQSLMG